jgi:two-component system chemotaxis sensor kinase CheA
MNLVGELVLGRNRLSQITFQLGEQYESLAVTKDLSETSSQIDFITTELQMAVMKTRMVPVAKVFNKLPRLIRDLCKEMGKDIDLQISGEETELDKSIIEEINDPLVHIIRNAADHGVELPAERKSSGKPQKGTVIVKAEHAGNHIAISIQDDGKGMDPEKLKKKGIEKGLITEAQANEMTKREAFNLIFAPGFSTAQKVTNVSGRGVGMDVVRTNISKLKGIVEIESEIGLGSTFIIKLPLTLAIIQGLLVEANKEVFSIPLGSVLEVVRVRKGDITSINGHEVIRLRDTVLPLARIADVLGTTSTARTAESRYIVVVALAEQRLGVVVDSLLGQKEVVIKSLGDYLGKVSGIAGSTILGDGRVIMIVDVGEFMNLCADGKKRSVRRLPRKMVAA